MLYELMRKDKPLAACLFNDNGNMINGKVYHEDEPELPFAHRCEPAYLQKWWEDRCIPLSRGKVDQMLKDKGILDNKQFLLNNLALSLTDYYWVRPMGSSYTWKQVNLFENNFKDDMHIFKKNQNESERFTPNSSLQGDLEKTWVIQDGKRILVKGNHNHYSQESINEVIASLLHKYQNYHNYVEYNLLRLKDTDYKYACYCEAFTNNDVEFVPAYDLLTSETKPNHISNYEQLIKLAVKYGCDEQQLRKDMEYQILTDYIISNKDRHMNNIGFLRDGKTLRFISMAPIFDSGNSMFNDLHIPNNLRKLEINSFAKTEEKLLSYVTHRNIIDFDKLPSGEEIAELYKKDPQMEEDRIREICCAYNKKIDLLKGWINGQTK